MVLLVIRTLRLNVKIDACIFLEMIFHVNNVVPPVLPLSDRLVENYAADASRDERASIEFNNGG